jgi:hypothetical protein
MAGISLVQRDLVETRTQLTAWFGAQLGEPDVELSDLRTANAASGWSSESLVFSATGRPDVRIRHPHSAGRGRHLRRI